MSKENVNSLIRTLLSLIGSLLVGHGAHYFFGHVVDTAYWQEFTGVALALVSVIWSVSSKTLSIEMLQGVIRQVITFVSGYVLSVNLVSSDTVASFGALITALLPYIYGVLSKKKSDQLDNGEIVSQDLKKTG